MSSPDGREPSIVEEAYRELAKQGYEVVKDFMPNVATCALQDYGRLNDFLMKAREEFGD
jgi:hypothetical protein